jgi:hypothetical protein
MRTYHRRRFNNALLLGATIAATPLRSLAARTRRSCDLIINALRWSDDLGETWQTGSVMAGSDVWFEAVVSNGGRTATPPGVIIAVDFRVDGVPVARSDTYNSGLARGGTATLRANTGPDGDKLWNDVDPGTHAVQAIVDPDNLIPSEQNEGNNKFDTQLVVEDAAVGNDAGDGTFPVTDYGNWIAGNTSGAARETNRATLAAAIAAVGAGGGGVILIPAGHYYLQQANVTVEDAAIRINQNNITLRGAGIGKTVLHTRSDWTVQGGRVIRGHGIQIVGTQSSGSPRQNIVLEQFELDGGAGHTGNYKWPASTTTGDGWDVTHKGIIPCWDDYVDGVTIRDVYVHRYKGEILYVGGWHCGDLTIERVWSCDGNASALNTCAANMTISDCQFGGPNFFWQEWAQLDFDSTTLHKYCTFYDSRASSAGIGLAQNGSNQTATWSHCRFIGANWAAFGIFGDHGSGVELHIEDCYIEDVGSRAVGLNAEQSTKPNYNVNFERNKVIGNDYMVLTYGGPSEINHLYDRNEFVGNGGGAMFYYAGSVWTNVTVSNNTWRNAKAESTNGGGNTGAPSLSNNAHGSNFSDTEAPSVPQNLVATAGCDASVWLRWDASTDNFGVSGYKVYRNGSYIATARHRWWMDRNSLSSGTQYSYTVSSFDFAGNESNQSMVVSAMTP